jgi:hypothetical protein
MFGGLAASPSPTEASCCDPLLPPPEAYAIVQQGAIQ